MESMRRRSENAAVPGESAIAGLVAGSIDPAVVDPAAPDAVPRLRRISREDRLRQLDQFMPVVLLLVFYHLGHAGLAILAAIGWSMKTVYIRSRRGMPVGVGMLIVTAYFAARAAVSMAARHGLVDFGVNPEAVYLGIGMATKMLIGLAVIGTILMGRPLASMAVHWVAVIPEAMSSHPRFISAMRNVTWVVALYAVGTSVSDFMLSTGMCVTYFLLMRQVLNSAVALMLISGTAVYLNGALAKVPGWPGLAKLLNSSELETGTDTDEPGTANSASITSE